MSLLLISNHECVTVRLQACLTLTHLFDTLKVNVVYKHTVYLKRQRLHNTMESNKSQMLQGAEFLRNK